ncbi:MAG: homoserine kinase [Candidatus Nanopelagicales bacterium]
MPVTASVSVPATSANLGPGFDALGLALDLRDEYAVEFTGSDVVVQSTGADAASLPTDESHLVARALRAGLAEFGGPEGGFVLTCRNTIPQGRGLGSSAAAIVGGLALAAAVSGAADPARLLRLATRLEGHPDNAAAALLGGLTVAWMADGDGRAVTLPVHPDVVPVIFVPDRTSPTAQARAALPDSVPHADAAFNAGRSALLIAAMTSHPELLFDATGDRLHQEQRRAAYPEALDLVTALRADGLAAVVSGAGPTVLVLTHGTGAAAVVARAPEGYTARVARVGVGVATPGVAGRA